MNFSLSPIGIFLVVAVNFVLFIVFQFFWNMLPAGQARRVKILCATLLVVTAAMTWDAFIVGYNKEKYCKQAGVYVEELVRVEGYYDDIYSWVGEDSAKHLVNSSAFRYIEYRDWRDNKYYRLERDGQRTTRVIIDRPHSRYHLKNSHSDATVAYLVRMSRSVVLDTETNKVIGEGKSYYLMPSWVDRLWLRFFDNPEMQCLYNTRLPETVLLPAD